MRAIWNGHIRFSLVTIPIRLFSAIDTKETVSFNQLHKEDTGRVGYDKKCKKCGKSLSQQDIVKGYEYEPDKYVMIEPEDFDKVKIKSNKIIEIEGFVDSSEVHPTLYDSPYFIGPDGEVASQPYALLNKTLKDSSKLAVGRIVLRRVRFSDTTARATASTAARCLQQRALSSAAQFASSTAQAWLSSLSNCTPISRPQPLP
jgi:DNA end-binding protein Ku